MELLSISNSTNNPLKWKIAGVNNGTRAVASWTGTHRVNIRVSLELGVNRLLEFSLTAPNARLLVRLREAVARRLLAGDFLDNNIDNGEEENANKSNTVSSVAPSTLLNESGDDDALRECANRLREALSSRVHSGGGGGGGVFSMADLELKRLILEAWGAARGANL